VQQSAIAGHFRCGAGGSRGRAGLKIQCPQGRVSSTLTVGSDDFHRQNRRPYVSPVFAFRFADSRDILTLLDTRRLPRPLQSHWRPRIQACIRFFLDEFSWAGPPLRKSLILNFPSSRRLPSFPGGQFTASGPFKIGAGHTAVTDRTPGAGAEIAAEKNFTQEPQFNSRAARRQGKPTDRAQTTLTRKLSTGGSKIVWAAIFLVIQ
jgi:hypothetical protein